MGLAKWLAKVGAPGGTARWAVQAYRYFRVQFPDTDSVSDQEIFGMMVEHRMRTLPNPEQLAYMQAVAKIAPGLRTVVIAIIMIESKMLGPRDELSKSIVEAIEEILGQSGLPVEVVWGQRAV